MVNFGAKSGTRTSQLKYTCMTKLQNLSLFSKQEMQSKREKIFLEKPLGKIYQTIPFEKLSELFPNKKVNSGAKPWLTPSGCIGLMILKHYLGLSDEKLIERINSDWEMQCFCGIQLKDNEQIKDTDLPSRIKQFIGENIDYNKMQEIFIQHWKPLLKNTKINMNDATCYESYIRFPTDVKLLWECCTYIYNSTKYICKELSEKLPKSKYNRQTIKQLSYQKKKRKTYKQTQKRKKSLLYLLNKLIGQLNDIAQKHQLILPQKVNIVKKVYEQQLQMFENIEKEIENRIVSIFKSYIRPIVRGKENKSVEFGAKVTKSQVDGINIIEHLSFDAYNECNDLKTCVINHKMRFGECKAISADKIYATNPNRTYLHKQKIEHNFVPKGRKGKYENQKEILRKELNKERSTRLEGSFGNEKNNYTLRKIKARTQATEIVWIFFGIFAANCVNISKRGKNEEKIKIKQKRIKF